MQSTHPRNTTTARVAACVALFGFLAFGWWLYRSARDDDECRAAVAEARAKCRQWADKLDRQTTETGVYIRWQGETLPDKDPWGNDLRVDYSAGGLAENVTVRSLGPDGKSHTDDDVVEQRLSVNLKGVGAGIKKNAEETAHHIGKGLVRGVVDGGKESIRGAKKADAPERLP